MSIKIKASFQEQAEKKVQVNCFKDNYMFDSTSISEFSAEDWLLIKLRGQIAARQSTNKVVWGEIIDGDQVTRFNIKNQRLLLAIKLTRPRKIVKVSGLSVV